MTTKTKKRKKLTSKQRLEELKQYIGLCFVLLEGDMLEAAARSGLSLATCYRLWHGDHTLAVRFGTVQVLGYAAGLRLQMTEYDVTVELVED